MPTLIIVLWLVLYKHVYFGLQEIFRKFYVVSVNFSQILPIVARINEETKLWISAGTKNLEVG